MFPASRSLLPASVGLAEWIGAHGWGGVYPQWYLGAPVRYVTGVVWPAVILGLERVFLGVSGLELSVAAMMAAIGVGVVGVGALAGWLAKDTTQKLRYTGGVVGLVAGVVFLLNPWVWVSSLGLADGGGGLGRLWLPWLIVGAGWILGRKRYGYRERILGSTLVAFAVLVSTDLLFDILLIGVVGGWVAQTSSKRRKQAWGRWVGLLVAGVGLASVWYGMDYWWQIAGVPIVGGRSLAGAVGHLWGFMAYLVPVGLVLMGVQRWGKRLSRPLVWVGLWLGVFGLMSVWRLVNDVDFWQDWSGWGVELAVGVAVLVGLVVGEWRVSRDVIAPGFVRLLLWRLKEGITLLVRPGRLLLDKLGATPGKAHFTKLMRRSTESGSVRNSHNNGRLVTTPIWFGGLILFYAVGWGVAWHYRAGWLPRERVAGSVEERVVGWVDEVYRECLDTKESGSVSLGARRDKCGRVFVSGTPTFWLNALAPEVPQVRGGRDSGRCGQAGGRGCMYCGRAMIRLRLRRFWESWV